MTKSRLGLQTILEAIPGVVKVYFQPPESLKLQYPCIIYEKSNENPNFAGNALYKNTNAYNVMCVDKNPDSLIPGYISELPMCKFNRHYTKDNLNHDVYIVYY